MNDRDLAQMEALCATVRALGARGWTPATSGNFSIRLDAKRIAVTRSGRDKRSLTPSDLMLIDADARPIDKGKPSAEVLLHTQIYARDGDVKAVLHVHSPAATLASRQAVGAGFIRLEGYELLKAFEGITTHDTTLDVPVLPNHQDIEQLARLAAPHLRKAHLFVYLIAGHGVYAWGRDLESASRHLDAIDFLLTCYLEERRIGHE